MSRRVPKGTLHLKKATLAPPGPFLTHLTISAGDQRLDSEISLPPQWPGTVICVHFILPCFFEEKMVSLFHKYHSVELWTGLHGG